MNLYRLLQQRAESGRFIKIGVIGVGHFSTMFLAQARLTPGMQLVGTANRNPEKAKQSCPREIHHRDKQRNPPGENHPD